MVARVRKVEIEHCYRVHRKRYNRLIEGIDSLDFGMT